ncbi:polyisoprenoid-binding protein YceI [Actinoplanes lutulentus]|uniref:Polyisoprenoid-binding protein YceI n=1 Tax=Actinoplanes lutulentus TaxID=1287878 RepID=A0A327ZEG2_9ACTN|nr:YceI family protein [Actinoplanes lutulentus]MBB2942780.1 polyisoprenoid-binding protein YceI [Actinoplanes lutulentus]RAK38360.1 polyisoprenoid-binding protein YceI [Actinoplanes lutulentus]
MNTLIDISAGTYRIDPARSVCRLVATHAFGLHPVTGTMAVSGGTVTVAEDPERSIASAELDAASFTTDDPRRDRDIRGRRFLNTADHPEIGFRSTRCRRVADGWQLIGVLAVRGGTCEVVLDLSPAEAAGDGFRLVARCAVDRVAAGVGAGRPVIGRTVRVELDIHAVPVRARTGHAMAG